MPRQASTRGLASVIPEPRASSSLVPAPDTLPDNIDRLRKHWKWAAFSQFFFTFARLLAMQDVTLAVSGILRTEFALR